MDCRDINSYGIDRLAGEADAASRRELATHLATCQACREEMARLEAVWATLGLDPDAVVTPEFRRGTLALLEAETTRRRVRSFRSRAAAVRPLFRVAAMLLAVGVGFLIARAIGRPGAPTRGASVAHTAAAPLPDLASHPRLSNVSYRPAGNDGRVGIAFDVTTRQTLVGRPDEPQVSRLLAYLVSHNSETSGEKSRAIELVSEHYGARNVPASPEIVAALSNTLRRDANPGVRKKAADALASFPITPEIRTVFLEALRSDKNPAVRLAAVDALAASARQSPDASTIESLREKATDPQENGFVRAKAASALKAISF